MPPNPAMSRICLAGTGIRSTQQRSPLCALNFTRTYASRRRKLKFSAKTVVDPPTIRPPVSKSRLTGAEKGVKWALEFNRRMLNRRRVEVEKQIREGLVEEKDRQWLLHFRPGLKEVYFPKFQLVLQRTPKLPPTFARFKVPLSFTKLDLRDILWNMYHVRAFNIRAFVSQRPIQFIDNRPWRGGPKRRTFRRQSAKFMTIEMDEPFYWPKVPSNYQAWDKGIADMQKAEQDASMNSGALGGAREENMPWHGGSTQMEDLSEHRRLLRQEAKLLLSGKARWQPTWKTLDEKGVVSPSLGRSMS